MEGGNHEIREIHEKEGREGKGWAVVKDLLPFRFEVDVNSIRLFFRVVRVFRGFLDRGSWVRPGGFGEELVPVAEKTPDPLIVLT